MELKKGTGGEAWASSSLSGILAIEKVPKTARAASLRDFYIMDLLQSLLRFNTRTETCLEKLQ